MVVERVEAAVLLGPLEGSKESARAGGGKAVGAVAAAVAEEPRAASVETAAASKQ